MSKGTVCKVIIMGRLGQDPKVRASKSGATVANINVVTNELGARDASGNRQESTEWHRCVLFGKTAELAQQHLSKASMVYLEGRLQTRKWQDNAGNDRWSTEIVVNEMQFVGGGQASQSVQQPRQQRQPQTQQSGFNQPAPTFDNFACDYPC